MGPPPKPTQELAPDALGAPEVWEGSVTDESLGMAYEPTEPPEPADSKPTEPTEPPEPADSKPTEPTEPPEPADSKPTEPPEPADSKPTEPPEPADSKPIEPTEPPAPRQFDHAVTSGLRRFLCAYRRPLLLILALGVVVAFVLVVLPQAAGFGSTLKKLRNGEPAWLGLCIVFEILSLVGYVAILRAVFSCHGARIGWSASYQITMAGVVATKLFAAAGAGGVALTAWALRASGLGPRTVARRMASFEILLYTVYMASLVVFGFGLALGVFTGSAPAAITIIPACLGALVIALVLCFKFIPADIDRRVNASKELPPRLRPLLARLATVPRTLQSGVATALDIVRDPQVGLLGAIAYWGFDIAVLWGAFHAFGAAPAFPVVVMGYFVGMLANAIPLPGGIGGVEGGMIGAFLAFGVNGSTTILAVLAYRAVSFWLPTLPGIIAYFQLRRTVAGWRETEGAPA
jgi:putative heme transporter